MMAWTGSQDLPFYEFSSVLCCSIIIRDLHRFLAMSMSEYSLYHSLNGHLTTPHYSIGIFNVCDFTECVLELRHTVCCSPDLQVLLLYQAYSKNALMSRLISFSATGLLNLMVNGQSTPLDS